MPKVGDKEFDYTPQGVAAAKKESAATGIPMSDGAMRSEQTYAGGGQVGFDRIGQDLGPKINTGNTVPDFSYDDSIPRPGYGDNPMERPEKHVGDAHWFDDPRKGGGAYKEGGEVKKKKKTLKEKIQSVSAKLRSNKKSSKKPKKKMKIWKDGKVSTESKSKKKEDKNIKKNIKKINKLGSDKLIIPKNVDVTKSKPTGKLKKGMQSVTITEGGAYPTYKKKSKPAKSFRKAFSAAKGEGKKTFMWDGRKYTTKVK